MSLKIGVSGVRGIIGESLTQQVISDFAKAFGTLIQKKSMGAPVKNIFIGRDTRTSGEFLRKTVLEGLLATGCRVKDLGLCPTPIVLFATRHLKADGAIIITASHNPAQWNGLKFVRSDGTFLTKKEAGKLIAVYKSKKFILPANKRAASVLEQAGAIKAHLDKVLESIDTKAVKKAKFKVALDYCNGTGVVATPYLLEKLGCEVVAINSSANGKFAHNPEPVAANLAQLCKFVKKTKADAGFAQDPDADRLAIVSEKGIAIGEENTLALAVKHVLTSFGSRVSGLGSRREPRTGNREPIVVVNLSTSRMIDDIAEEFRAQVYRSAVGETNVVDLMRKKGAIIGGEGNGGVIYPEVNFGRDSFIGMALILEYMAKSKKKISQLVGGIKQYHIEKMKIECPQDKIAGILGRVRKYAVAGGRDAINRVSTIDGVKIEWPDGWVHVRGSNTEPIIRIMAEAPTEKLAKQYIDEIKGHIKC